MPVEEPERRTDSSRAAGESTARAVDELVLDYLDRHASNGGDVLEELCLRHPGLAGGLRARIAVLERAGLVGDVNDAHERSFPERLGDFRLIESLGGGGMGVVYLAEQVSLGREVALKLIRPGELYFPGARERFQREVTTVAKLQHPGIVPVYTVGEEGGIPYFAMELVRGSTLAEVLAVLAGRDPSDLSGVDLERAISDRFGAGSSTPVAGPAPAALFRGGWAEVCLRIVRDVAVALDHAHGRGVLHRDVKPSNVMITRDGRVLLLDFGLSSATGVDRLTRSGSQLGSLPYMSPEQWAGRRDAVDRRSDVYALGVTLYEILTLELPFRETDRGLLRERILSGAPPRLRNLNGSVSTDAETVCLTAIERDPDRRYADAAELARDLSNVLELRPIRARRASLLLRTRRWSQRHPARAVALALGFLIVTGAPAGWALQERVASRKIEAESRKVVFAYADLADALAATRTEKERAESNLGTAIEVIDTLLVRIEERRLVDIPRMDELRTEVLGEALQLYRTLLDRSSGNPRLRLEMARIGYKLGEIEYRLGRTAEAEQEFSRARALILSLIDESSDPSDLLAELARNYGMCAVLEREAGCFAEAQEHGLRASAVILELVRHRPDAADPRRDLAVAELNLGELLLAVDRIVEAEAHMIRARELWRDLLALAPHHAGYEQRLATTLGNLSLVCFATGRAAEAESCLNEAVELSERAAETAPGHADHRAVLATLLTQRGQYFKDTGRYGQAAEDLSRCRETWMRLMADFPGRPQYRQDLARDTVLHAIVLRRIEDFDRADASFAEAIAIQRALAAEFPATPDYEAALAGQQMNYASLLMEVDRAQEAEVYFRQAVDVFVGLATRQPILSHQAEASAALHNFGRLLLTRGELSEARTCFERAIGFRRPCVDLLPESAMHREALRNHYWSLCAALARLTDHAATVLAAEELPRCLPRSADECLRAAQYVARCIPYAQSDAALSEVERASTGARYADRAMELLRQGAALGTPRFDVLRDDRDLAPLRERADFQVLLTTARR